RRARARADARALPGRTAVHGDRRAAGARAGLLAGPRADHELRATLAARRPALPAVPAAADASDRAARRRRLRLGAVEQLGYCEGRADRARAAPHRVRALADALRVGPATPIPPRRGPDARPAGLRRALAAASGAALGHAHRERRRSLH